MGQDRSPTHTFILMRSSMHIGVCKESKGHSETGLVARVAGHMQGTSDKALCHTHLRTILVPATMVGV